MGSGRRLAVGLDAEVYERLIGNMEEVVDSRERGYPGAEMTTSVRVKAGLVLG